MLLINDDGPAVGEVWLPFWMLEEVSAGMWKQTGHRKTWVRIAEAFTGDADLYGEWMMRVVDSWPNSCAHNLTKPGDKRPWIGHAAVAMAIGVPEDVVREAWSLLTPDQQDKANKKAQEAINEWRSRNA